MWKNDAKGPRKLARVKITFDQFMQALGLKSKLVSVGVTDYAGFELLLEGDNLPVDPTPEGAEVPELTLGFEVLRADGLSGSLPYDATCDAVQAQTCPDCKGSGKYQPLVGPALDCGQCRGSGRA